MNQRQETNLNKNKQNSTKKNQDELGLESLRAALGIDAYDAFKEKDYKATYKLLLPHAESGRPQAQSHLGWMYEKGLGVPQDYKKAVRLFRLSADMEYDKAQFNMGKIFDEGVVVPQDYNEAAKWYSLSAAQGFA